MSQRTDLDAQRAYYDERWRGVTRANPMQLARAVAVLEELHATKLASPRILDLGCGVGWLTSILGRFGPTTGIDLSPVAIQQARQRHPDIEFIEGDLFGATLPRTSFDVVVGVQVIEHVHEHGRLTDVIADVLRPQGHLILVTDNPWNLARWRTEDLERFAGAPQPIQNRLSARQLRTLLSRRFRDIDVRTILPGYGDRGVLRFAHSPRLRRLLASLGLRGSYDRMLLRMGCGLLLLAHARLRD